MEEEVGKLEKNKETERERRCGKGGRGVRREGNSSNSRGMWKDVCVCVCVREREREREREVVFE